jgi:hypothetical protein
MDTFMAAMSAAAMFTLGYGVVWTVRAVRRVGSRQFARALGSLVWAVLVTTFRLFLPERASTDSGSGVAVKPSADGFVGIESDSDGPYDVCTPRPGFNVTTGQLDDGADPSGVYLYGGYNGDDV